MIAPVFCLILFYFFGYLVYPYLLPIGAVTAGILLILQTYGILTGRYMKNINSFLTEKGISLSDLEGDNYDRITPSVWVGSRYLLLISGEIFAIDLEDLIWCYFIEITTKHKFLIIIPVGTTRRYSIKFVLRKGSEYTIAVPAKKRSDVIRTIHDLAPAVITGYSDKLAALQKNNFNEMIRYVDSKKA